MKIDSERAWELAEQMCLLDAWRTAGEIKDGHHLGVLSDEIAKQLATEDREVEASEVQALLLDALRGASDERHEAPPDSTADRPLADMGHCKIGDDDVWWWQNNATAEWTSDKPDWWDEQVRQWADE